jgi:hypothetical protein
MENGLLGYASVLREKSSNEEEFIQKNKHLLQVPSAEQAVEVDISFGEMNSILLQKTGDLTMHMIDLKN